jgi:LacI family transcriptional regulator
MRDVAREAGVSIATVSRVVNDAGPVAEPTRRRVLEAIRRLNYSPNLVAKSLVHRGTRNLALFVPDIMNPFFPAIARGVADAVASEGYTVVLCNTDDSSELGPHFERLLRGNFVDGAILCGMASDAPFLSELIPPDLPLVVMDRRVPGLRADSVEIDNRLGGFMATRHLLDVGCRRILHLGGPVGVSTAEGRLAGYLKALGAGEADEPDDGDVDSDLISRGPFRADSGYSRTRAALKSGLSFDGIFAANDLLALGALHALRQFGRRVPEDVAVIGFDDIYMAALALPPLSTVAQPTYRLGTIAGRMLMARLDRSAPPAQPQLQPQRVVLEPFLRIRESTRRERA